jgi:6-phosphogluconate dehydrogenase
MGANMSRRLARAGHHIVGYDRDVAAANALTADGLYTVASPQALAATLTAPRAVWLMVPDAVVDRAIDEIAQHMSAGDIIVDGGNSHYAHDARRAARLAERGIEFVDVGTSGGVWGLERGYCLMIGGSAAAFARLEPVFKDLAPGVSAASRQRGGTADPTPAEHGYLHCGSHGAGHFVKMVHNGIEYGLMAAYAEGFNLLHKQPQYEFDLPAVAELWRRGSVIGSWLLDLTAAALAEDPALTGFAGRVGDSGEGRWTMDAAVENAVPMPVLAAALFSRFSSRGEEDFANQLLSAMRAQFGGHAEARPQAPGHRPQGSDEN